MNCAPAMAFPTRADFLASFLHQQFLLPDSMIYYILKNPKLSKVYQKLIQSCKYFYIKNPILVIPCLEINDDGWKICSAGDQCRKSDSHININATTKNSNLNCKLWIINHIKIISTDSNAATKLIPKLYKCDATQLVFHYQKLTWQQFSVYSKLIYRCHLQYGILYSENYSEIPIENIIANLPNLTKFHYIFNSESNNVSSNTVKNLLQIPHFKNVTYFGLGRISSEFDIDSFYDYIKKFKDLKSCLQLKGILSDNYLNKLETIIDDIIMQSFKRFTIQYGGLNMTKWNAMRDLIMS